MVNATPWIGKQFITLEPKNSNKYVSYFWKITLFENTEQKYPIWFSNMEFMDSYLHGTDYVKKIIFLSIFTWNKLNQNKVMASIFKSTDRHSSITASISSNLNVGRLSGLYLKIGQKAEAVYSLSTNYLESEQMKYLSFVPTFSAVEITKKRAKALSNRVVK